MQDLQAFAAALEATPVSVCVVTEDWNSFLVFQHVPRFAGGVNFGLSEVVSAVKNQGQCGPCAASSVTQAVEWQLVLTSGSIPRGFHCSASGFHAHSTCETVRSRISSWRRLGYHCGGQCCHESGSSRILPDVLCSAREHLHVLHYEDD